jgi:hypothetical protein
MRAASMLLSLENCPTQRAPDGWESARFQAVYVASSWFHQSGVTSSHPPAGNAHRWATKHEQRCKYEEE